MTVPAAVVVVPCFNEARRLDVQAFSQFVRDGRAQLLFVDDGSTDATREVLAQIQRQAPEAVSVLALSPNRGKAEAVRRGMLAALERGAPLVGYADADLSTPLSALTLLLDAAERGPATVVLGSRVALLGHDIERKRMRHYLGRVFATVASVILRLPVYDTQCGAKFFRRTAALEAALAAPFHSAWAFDVELLGRLLIGAPGTSPILAEECLEVPLDRWRDVGGSRLGPVAMARAALELALINRALAERRRSVARG